MATGPKPPKKPGPARKIARAARAAVTAVTIAGQLASATVPDSETDPTLFVRTEAVSAEAPPPVLMVYQQRWVADQAQLKICEKSRRTGFTWAEAADNVLIAAAEGGSNVFYISATQDMAREYIEACAMWTRAFDYAAAEVSEGLYDDGEADDGSKRYIKTYEIVYPRSGKRIVALSSRPTNLRGKQGVIVIDEAAFHNDLAALIKAAMAMLLWGDKVRIISTHDGAENAFNQLIQEVRAGKRGSESEASVHRVTFRQAVADGLYQRVCLRKGIPWTIEGETKWVEAAYRFYGDDATEELDAVPSQSAGAYLSLTLIEQRMTSVPPPEGPVIVRGKWDDAFAYLPEDVRNYAIDGWIAENLTPHLARLHKDRRHVFGEDFARNRDQAVTVVLEQGVDLVSRCKIVLELQNCPFKCQERILFHLIDRLPRFRGGGMDASGNGAALAEACAQRYGAGMIEQVKASDSYYLQHMPKLRGALQDGTLTDIPRDEALRDDLRSIKLINGIPKIPRADTQSAGAKAAAADAGGGKTRRHGDFAIALFLAVCSLFREGGEIDYIAAPPKSSRHGGGGSDGSGWSMRANTSDDDLAGGGYGEKGGY